MQSLQSGMAMVGVDAPFQNIVVGVVLVEAVLLDLAYRVARIRPLVIKVHLVALPVLVWAMAGAALAGAAAVLAVALWALLNRKGVV